MNISKLIWLSCLIGTVGTGAATEKPTRRFTVAEEIGLALFNDPNGGPAEVRFSPDGNYIAVWSERGRLDVNRVDDSLQFYRSEDVENFVRRPHGSQSPSPLWVLTCSGKEGRIISEWRWLLDSSGIAYLERESGHGRVVLADVRNRTLNPLTLATEEIISFDIGNREHYVYAAADPEEREKRKRGYGAAAIASGANGLLAADLLQLIFPDHPLTAAISSPRFYLWVVAGNKRFQFKKDGEPLDLDNPFSLSPDGSSLLTTLPVPDVPQAWETLYPPPYPSSSSRIRAGHYSAHQFVRIDLQTSMVQALTEAPTADDAGWWWGGRGPSWSSDGEEVLLPGTFIKSANSTPSRPCVAVINLASKVGMCVETLKVRTETTVENGYHSISGARFVGGDRKRVMVSFADPVNESLRGTEYRRSAVGTWEIARRLNDGIAEHNGLEVVVKQSANSPPVLVATQKEVSKVVWDPNPWLGNVELGEASVYRWKDTAGRDWRGGLYKPPDYKPGSHYPLVIQNHGFDESKFLPSGVFPTGFAARALAGAGIMVLQVAGSDGCAPKMGSPDEGPCEVSGYESAVQQLVSEGVVDPERVGIIGFSRTCFYVMEMLTTASSVHIKAASITDGVMANYLQYMMFGELGFDSLIGAKPFGDGLQQWLERAPSFNLDKIRSPLLVVAAGPIGVLTMWEPYAGLRHLHKPVDLIMLNTDEHVLTNPAVRMASQGGSVDWFRFWLKNEEDPDPTKTEQYRRWRNLRKLQEENEIVPK